jgi:hypothetical protein
VIYLEDLATLETRGRRNGNARLSGQVRGMVVDAIRHLAAKAGLAVVTVDARGTSKYCPRCCAVLAHSPAPDRNRERGWRWAECRSCGLAGDRDHAASERIVARGLLSQAHVRTDRTQATTSPRWSATDARFPPSRLCGLRVSVRRDRCPRPALTSKRGPDQARMRLPVPPRPGRMKRLGVGWGFHRAVRATAVLPLGDYGPPPARPRPPGMPELLGQTRQSVTLPVSRRGEPGADGARTR